MANCFWSEKFDSWSDHHNTKNEALQYEDGSTFLLPPAGAGDQTAASAPAALGDLQCHFFPQAGNWAPTFDEAAEDRAASASRSHSEAEKRRRDRINAQFSTLRKLIPKSEKMDKAALLGHVVEHLRELKKEEKEVRKFSTIPTEVDEVIIDYFNEDESSKQQKENKFYIKASVCCDDRPELFAELSCALKSLRLDIVEVDMTSLGGRIKASFVLCAKDCCGTERNFCTNSLKQSLKLVLNRVAISSGTSIYSARSKRQRFFLS